MITISDVAAKAGVSRTTVSYVLSESGTAMRISGATRERVLNTAAELGYRRNELARAVTTGKTQMLGFWVMQSNREPVVRVLAGAMKEAEENGYSIKMLGFDNGSLDERTLAHCLEWRLSGILAIHAPGNMLQDLYPQILLSKIPFVLVDSQQPPPDCPHIAADSTVGMSAAVEHLIELGHRRIAFLGGRHSDEDSISGNREHAYRSTMLRCNLSAYVQAEYGDWQAEFSDWESGTTAQVVRHLLESTPRPTAIVCASDHMAMIVVRLAVERGIFVPHDLSVTGFDDVTVATLYNPPLTTVSQPFESIGRQAVHHLLNLDHEPKPVLPTKLIVRGSTAPAHDSS